MEQQSKKNPKATNYTYELERELQDPSMRKEIVEKCNARVNTLKNELRQGADRSAYEQLSLLLQGYMALKRVINKSIQS